VGFNKRRYHSLKEIVTDFWFPVRNRKQLREIRKQGLIAPDFQERLMLAVTAVNGCRYCSYAHTRMAMRGGMSREEVRGLLEGDVGDCPEEELPAVLYAQHWAESGADPNPEALDKLKETYGREKSEAIHLMLRMIRFGNLLGNTFDYFLYRLSFGTLGN
jgi:AhpD family alkylhydroperoxidase